MTQYLLPIRILSSIRSIGSRSARGGNRNASKQGCWRGGLLLLLWWWLLLWSWNRCGRSGCLLGHNRINIRHVDHSLSVDRSALLLLLLTLLLLLLSYLGRCRCRNPLLLLWCHSLLLLLLLLLHWNRRPSLLRCHGSGSRLCDDRLRSWWWWLLLLLLLLRLLLQGSRGLRFLMLQNGLLLLHFFGFHSNIDRQLLQSHLERPRIIVLRKGFCRSIE
mmetsp:Transcript_10089/g.22120  ORF Transcript_10089/g.22120 Transcript_10089/m.22120 type:complete len:218 (+) Transcript_10089:4400-5053(+)